MTGRQLFFGLAFTLLGAVILVFNRMLTEEGLRTRRWLVPWKRELPLLARITVVVGGVVSILLGLCLLIGILKWAS